MTEGYEIPHLLYWVALATIIAVGGFMRGFSGFGTPLVMVPLLSFLMQPKEAVLLSLSIDVLAMIPMIPGSIKLVRWQPITPLVIGAVIAIPIGAWVLVVANPANMKVIISTIVLVFACLLLSGWTYKGDRTITLSFFIGIFSGVANGATGIGGPPIAAFFIARGMTAKTLRSSLNIVAFIMEGLAALTIYLTGDFEIENVVKVLYLFPLMLVFVWFGAILFKIVDNKLFNKSILYFLVIFGIYILITTILI